MSSSPAKSSFEREIAQKLHEIGMVKMNVRASEAPITAALLDFRMGPGPRILVSENGNGLNSENPIVLRRDDEGRWEIKQGNAYPNSTDVISAAREARGLDTSEDPYAALKTLMNGSVEEFTALAEHLARNVCRPALRALVADPVGMLRGLRAPEEDIVMKADLLVKAVATFADVKVSTPNPEARNGTALHAWVDYYRFRGASSVSDHDSLQVILANGADPNVLDDTSLTPLYMLARDFVVRLEADHKMMSVQKTNHMDSEIHIPLYSPFKTDEKHYADLLHAMHCLHSAGANPHLGTHPMYGGLTAISLLEEAAKKLPERIGCMESPYFASYIQENFKNLVEEMKVPWQAPTSNTSDALAPR